MLALLDQDTRVSVLLMILWIWLGLIAVRAVCYWLLRAWLKKAHKAPVPIPKYADRLRQRMQKNPAHAQAATSDAADTPASDPNKKAKRRP